MVDSIFIEGFMLIISVYRQLEFLTKTYYNYEQRTLNSRKGQRTNQKYRNLVGSDQQI